MLEFMTLENGLALLTLTVLEIVLGIDNVVFISILTNKLPASQQDMARRIGLLMAMAGRIGLLFTISAIMKMHEPLFTLMEHEISVHDIILLIGGMFLIGKATMEIHHKLEEPDMKAQKADKAKAQMLAVLVQIFMLDLVFSMDSVITAVGMVKHIPVMITAIIIAVSVMMIFAGPISRFVEGHPTMKMLALAFLVLIGVVLVAEGLGQHINKGYIYFAMAFSFGVELLNLKVRKNRSKTAKLTQS
jgi:predicted tellurium resistance membrane protein TerC